MATSATFRRLTRAAKRLVRRMVAVAPAVVIGLTVSACGGDSSPSSGTPAFANAARPQINALLTDSMTPGAVVYVQSPQGNWLESFGTAVRGTNTPIPTNAHFRVGSITKTWTGTVILQLVQEGRLSLGDTVDKFVANVPNGNMITIEQLLNMRSGLYNYSTSLAFNQTLDAQPDKVWTTTELLDIAEGQPVYFAPGADFHYSNTNTVLLGLIIEQLTGMSAADAMNARLFAPLGLSNTFLPPQANTALPAPAPDGYQWGTNAETTDSDALSPERQTEAKNGTLQPTDVTSVNTSWAWTAGSGISTVTELAAYVQRMVGGGYLSADLQAQRLASCTPVDPSDPMSASYCMGLAKFGTFYGHTGEIPGFNTFMGYDPATKTTIVTWATTAAAPDGHAPANMIAQIIMGELSKAAEVPSEGRP
ncbi:MAG: beta-lactamase family protein [Burkholderia sp.]|jgi:D-alanyl-D-alanine carboxypeptidase|uniref:serine hydrolase domain-containing protein n=2 Tax=Burkholderiaceae TaxID=119060 RepID=UPI0015898A5E|nr:MULTISPECIES: serine hydrolase domain-containing protein [Burkholderia]MCA3780461.1 beta-lactamase family protein [Burkholderia sp.]MCA3787740.1 beta-lactamase family protein [Burkholderia sp.]MCA3795153.1 beta-lactamase family protein [Burkholderia sp.]MCA3799188.1 beta-lactamase family protein [Burkholderia sp.]MCA3814114.1 beta-lactamase family protein [Burkholderia sp.]